MTSTGQRPGIASRVRCGTRDFRTRLRPAPGRAPPRPVGRNSNVVCLGSWRRFLFTAGVTGGYCERFQVYARLLYMSTVLVAKQVSSSTLPGRSPAISPPPEHRPIQSRLPAHAQRAKRRVPAAHAGAPVFETGDVQIGRHQHRWLIHASSTATFPSASRVAVGEGWISRTGVPSKTRHSTEPGVVRISTTRQLKRAMFGSGGTRHVAYPRLVHGDGPPASRVAVGEGWTSRTGVPSRGRHPHRSRGRTNQHDAAVEKGDVRFGRHQARGLSTPRPRRRSLSQSSRGGRGVDKPNGRFIERTPSRQTRGRTNQHDAAVEKGDVRFVQAPAPAAHPRLVHGDGP